MPIRSAAAGCLFTSERGFQLDIDLERPACLRTVPTACGQAADRKARAPHNLAASSASQSRCVRRSENSATATTFVAVALGAILPLHDVRNHASAVSHMDRRRIRIVFLSRTNSV